MSSMARSRASSSNICAHRLGLARGEIGKCHVLRARCVSLHFSLVQWSAGQVVASARTIACPYVTPRDCVGPIESSRVPDTNSLSKGPSQPARSSRHGGYSMPDQHQKLPQIVLEASEAPE